MCVRQATTAGRQGRSRNGQAAHAPPPRPCPVEYCICDHSCTARPNHACPCPVPLPALQMMPELGFGPEDNDRLVASYSGGWQMRMCLGKILLKVCRRLKGSCVGRLCGRGHARRSKEGWRLIAGWRDVQRDRQRVCVLAVLARMRSSPLNNGVAPLQLPLSPLAPSSILPSTSRPAHCRALASSGPSCPSGPLPPAGPRPAAAG